MIEVAIVGFGFSAVPLVRELEATGTPFTIISAEFASVWDGLSESNRLDFDLVSSYLTSFYSFDLVETYEKDRYPTAKEYFQRQQKWRAHYNDQIVRDEVIRVDNFEDHSVIHTKSGTIEARHVVFATGFGRSITTELKTIDYQAPARTAVFDTMGDSVNLIISHLVPNGVKVIIRTNGFHARDKVVPAFGTTYTLDQLEFHNYRYVSHDRYASIIYGTPHGSENPYLLGDQFPDSVRDESSNNSRSRPVNGAVAIKYWPIDEYSRTFGDNLEHAISTGYVLNDIAMWLHTGRAIVVPKDTPIDFDKKTITYSGIERSFDLYIKGDAETPRLPPILAGGTVPYQYVHREAFMGVIPEALHNVYLIGYTRPYTGGLANIIEMQGLFVHKLVTQPAFHEKIHRNLGQRIATYNEHYYVYDQPRRYEHLVYSGFYTDDIARLIGIDYRPDECQSLRDLIFYYAFPNNAFKYRLKGVYAVPGVSGLIAKVNRQYNRFILSFAYILCSGIKDERELQEWLPQIERNHFNDMRHKDAYRPFLESYLQTYRALKKCSVRSGPDPQWDAMVTTAARARDRVLQKGKATPYAVDEDIASEIERLISWMASGTKLADFGKLELDAKRAALIDAMLHPPEFDLPYLSDQADR